MKTIFSKSVFLILALFSLYLPCKAATITNIIIPGYNAPNLEICEKSNLQIKFAHTDFLFDNTFTVEIAANGDFVNGPIISLIGQRTVAGNSTNQYIDVSFPPPPNDILANTNYQLRIKGSSPLTYSSPNLYPFKVAKVGTLPDVALFPENYWRGSFFTWKPNITTIITNANTQDMFNPSNYLGYVTKADLSFDLNWGFDVESAPGTKFDTSNVCGSHANFYSIRMRRKINFEAGYYIFGGGGDDGFRLSTDGGTTWLINLWADHEFTGKLHNNGCGVYLDAGPKNVVVDYYERAEQSRFQLIIKRTGDPLASPLQITNPIEGTSVCLQSAPFQMLSTAPGAETWSGPGVSPNGIFNPQAAGLGSKTITYQTGMSGFGSNCIKNTSVTIQVVPSLSAAFTGLDSTYCQGDSTIALKGQIPGGTFFGQGVTGTAFSPAAVAPGQYTIGHTLSQCGVDTVLKSVRILPKPDAQFTDLPDSVYLRSPNISLVPVETGGVFSGDGVISSTLEWANSILPAGDYTITYNLKKGGCANTYSQKVRILNKEKPKLIIYNLVIPNGDVVKNKDWIAKGGTSGIKVVIINRWGKEVYKGTSQGEVLCNASDLPDAGEYFFHLSSEEDTWTGNLTVIRK